jgi:hypothetical protein|nr:MAG TPA: hypothetical protein [Caudoviricetes sp.]
MGKFNEYSQKATPADNDTLMIYDATSKANKLSPFSGIWNWIVEKLTNAVISNLQTSNKTVLGAINELNSNFNNKAYSTNFDTRALETIEINLGGTADAAAEILLMDKYRMFFVHAYSADGKTIGEIVTKSIYGDNVTPATNNTIISIHVGSWDSGTAIISYTQGRPSLSIK